MIKISPKTLYIISPVFIFLTASFVWYLVLYQAISFLSGFMILVFLIFLAFWQNFSTLRMAGELIGLKSKKQVFIVSLVLVLGLAEIIWSISFLPFSFFILGGMLAVIFGVSFDIYKEYFKKLTTDNPDIKRILLKDLSTGIVLIIIFIFISQWLPIRAF